MIDEVEYYIWFISISRFLFCSTGYGHKLSWVIFRAFFFFQKEPILLKWINKICIFEIIVFVSLTLEGSQEVLEINACSQLLWAEMQIIIIIYNNLRVKLGCNMYQHVLCLCPDLTHLGHTLTLTITKVVSANQKVYWYPD